MEILCSRNEQNKTTTIIVHNAMPAELRAIKEAMKRTSYWNLAQHPVFIFAVSIEILRSRLQVGLAWADTEAIKASRVAEKQADSNASVEMQSESVQAESRITLYRLHQIVQLMGDIKLATHELSKVKAWCCEFDNSGESPAHHEYFKNAGAIILRRLEDLEDSLQHADVQTQTILAFTQSSRQSVRSMLLPNFILADSRSWKSNSRP